MPCGTKGYFNSSQKSRGFVPTLILFRFPEGTHFIIYVYVISPPVDQWDYVKPLAVECIVSRIKQTNRCPTRNTNPNHHKVVSVLLLQVKMLVLKNTCYTEFFNIHPTCLNQKCSIQHVGLLPCLQSCFVFMLSVT